MINEIKITSLSGRGSVFMKAGDFQGYWLGPVDWGQVPGQHQTYNYYNQVGESIVSTTVLTRSMSITGWVVAIDENTMRPRCDFLNTFFSPVEDYELEYQERKIRFRPDSSIVYSPERRANNRKVRRFLLQATCPYPLFTNRDDTTVPFDFSTKRFRFPSGFGMGGPVVFALTDRTYSTEVYNAGGFQTGLRAELRFSGEVQNPRINNLTTGKFIGVTRMFQRGERLTICTAAGDKRMTLRTAEGKELNLIKYRDYRMSWVQLVPGTNLLALDCDNLDQRGSMTLTVSFTPLYLEVE